MVAFAEEHGLPIAIKAAYGGGGRGLKVAREMAEIPALFESATREAVTAFGRGECFVERYLDKPRHVETQCLADTPRQRGGGLDPGLLAAAAASEAGRGGARAVPLRRADVIGSTRASKAILRSAGYVGAGTCEFLVGQDGTISFLEVNTRLQVEHPVSEEVTGLDLVREMFRIADGEAARLSTTRRSRGHSIEFRINAEDAGRNFMPAPGTLTAWRRAVRAGRAGRRGIPERDDGARQLRLAGRQDHRHRRRPRARRWPAPGGRWRAGGGGDADRGAVPSRGAGRSGVHRGGRPVRGAHPLDRDRVRRGDPAVRRAAAPRCRSRPNVERVVVEVNGKRLEVVVPAGFGGGQRCRAVRPARQEARPARRRWRERQGARRAMP